MNTLLDASERQTSRDQDAMPEISLGTGTILGIFFALAVLCAVFFGFGYALGVKRPATVPIVAAALPPATNFSGFKPAPGNPLSAAAKPAETVIVPDTSRHFRGFCYLARFRFGFPPRPANHPPR